MNPAVKRYKKQYGPIADAVARLDIAQTDRELVAEALAEALDGQRDFMRPLFTLTASDPLCLCAGYGDTPCPEGIEIRIAMHLSSAPDGRSAAWKPRKPEGIRCVPCGARHFNPTAWADPEAGESLKPCPITLETRGER